MNVENSDLARWLRFAAKGGIGKCTAVLDCVAGSTDDLMFIKDDEITVLMQTPDNANLYLGYCEGIVGLFRGHFVQFRSRLKKPVMVRRSSAFLQGYTLARSPSPNMEIRIPSPMLHLGYPKNSPQSRTRNVATPVLCKSIDVRLTDSPRPSNNELITMVSKLASVLEDISQYRRMLACTGNDAQRLLDMVQSLLYSPGLESGFRRSLVVAAQRLSQNANLYPICFVLDNVQLIGEEPVAAGSFGDVYQGKLEEQSVCLKVVRIYQESRIDYIFKRFSREAILWGQLSHPNLLPFFGLYRFRSRMCIVSPWMENGPIPSYLENTPRVDRVLLASDVAAGVSYLHKNNIIHGDLKGANILVTDAGRACLADFGLSSVTDSKILNWTSNSSVTSKGGSLRWQAPELLNVDDDFVPNNKESDVYALACVYYEIFTGKIPFVEIPRDASVFLKVRRGMRPTRPVPSSSAWTTGGLTEAIWDLIQECWRENPTARPGVDTVIITLDGVRPDDRRPVETVDMSASASFRNSLAGTIVSYGLADLETLLKSPPPAEPGIRT